MTRITTVSCSEEHAAALKRHHLSPSDCFHYGILLKCNELGDFSFGKHNLIVKNEELMDFYEERIDRLINNNVPKGRRKKK